jgi:hypothetical protein
MTVYKVLYQKVLANQITRISDEEAFRLMDAGWSPRWFAPVIDLKNREILFSCTLEEVTDEEKRS